MRRTPAILALGYLTAAAGIARGQDDLRDTITDVDGRTWRGRVATPFAATEVELRQGGKRVRIARERIADVQLVDDRCAEFSRLQQQAGDRVDAHFALARWAHDAALPDLAAAQAILVLTLDPDHRGAHELLGHREHPRRGWLWRDGRAWRTLAELDAAHASWGRALELESEHFRVRTDAGIATAALALLDLEHLYATLHSEFGAELGWRAALEKVDLRVWTSADDFPALAGEARPYYQPRPFGDFGATWVANPGERPTELFATAAQALLYRCVAADPTLPGGSDRLCAALEIGFARWLESRFSGPPGRAVRGDPGIEHWQADLAQNARRQDLPNLLHLSTAVHFYGGLGGAPEVHWASVQCFLTFLLDPRVTPPRHAGVARWLRRALQDGLGDSSTAFDEAFGAPIEDLEQPFRTWLDVVGRAPRR